MVDGKEQIFLIFSGDGAKKKKTQVQSEVHKNVLHSVVSQFASFFYSVTR